MILTQIVGHGNHRSMPLTSENSSNYINRELSWIKFNERVLSEAENKNHPLLERLRFLSISGNNLDEFFMVRVAGLIGQVNQGIDLITADGMTPQQQLDAIYKETDILIEKQQDIWNDLSALLSAENIRIVEPDELSRQQKSWLREYFTNELFPILTPQALDPSHPFPFIPNLGISMVMDFERQTDKRVVRELLMLPSSTKRFVRLPGHAGDYISLDNIILTFVDMVFPGHDLLGYGTFRIIRDSDLEIEEEAEDLVLYFKSAIKRRRRGQIVRLELADGLSKPVENLLEEIGQGMSVSRSQVHGFIGIADLAELVSEERNDLKFTNFTPRFPERIREYDGDCFAAIKAKDILVHHPYESFEVVVAFLEQAAADPNVVAIKQTLYRAGRQSKIIRALIDAAEAGKSVTAVVELRARFDEEQNIFWADALERAGVQVVYGFIELKTHAKVSMVVRHEETGVTTYCHFGTGNYHPINALIYTDLSYFTADPVLANDAIQLFNYITGYVAPNNQKLLKMSPLNMRNEITKLINAEAINASEGKPAAIWAKMNSLVDADIIDKLYKASQAGVQIDLVIRGICCLRPGVAGLSDNIRVKSIVGRYLEHSRIWAFGNGAKMPHAGAKLYISSADWMPRNLDRRVEYMLPVENETVHEQILEQVLLANLIDNQQSWQLNSDGEYSRAKVGKKKFNLHDYFMNNPSLSGRGKALKKRKTVPKLYLGD